MGVEGVRRVDGWQSGSRPTFLSRRWRGKGGACACHGSEGALEACEVRRARPAILFPRANADTNTPASITAMALARPLPPLWQTLWPALHAPVRPALRLPFLQRLAQPWGALATPFGALAIPALPALPSLADIWNGILNAVPKKKTSYRKKRQRFMAGKALKDITSLNRCSGCGRVKRMHVLCPYCVDGTP